VKNFLGKFCLFWLVISTAFIGFSLISANRESGVPSARVNDPRPAYVLPRYQAEGENSISVEKALASRRSHRNFQKRELSLEHLSQILWAAYGMTKPISDRSGLRTAPSAGALYPLEIYAVVGNVAGVEAGVYKYVPLEHKIVRTVKNDVREELSAAALGQGALKNAPLTVVYSAVFDRVTGRYGARGRERYVFIEVGHSAQNVYLQAEALRLGTCAIGAFTDKGVKELLQLPEEEAPLYLMPVGYAE
jgi:SagB-type dehydrogenase family enzyme